MSNPDSPHGASGISFDAPSDDSLSSPSSANGSNSARAARRRAQTLPTGLAPIAPQAYLSPPQHAAPDAMSPLTSPCNSPPSSPEARTPCAGSDAEDGYSGHSRPGHLSTQSSLSVLTATSAGDDSGDNNSAISSGDDDDDADLGSPQQRSIGSVLSSPAISDVDFGDMRKQDSTSATPVSMHRRMRSSLDIREPLRNANSAPSPLLDAFINACNQVKPSPALALSPPPQAAPVQQHSSLSSSQLQPLSATPSQQGGSFNSATPHRDADGIPRSSSVPSSLGNPVHSRSAEHISHMSSLSNVSGSSSSTSGPTGPAIPPPEEFLAIFKDSPNKGVKWLFAKGVCREENADDVSKLLLGVTTLSKTRIGRFLGDSSPINQAVLRAVLEKLDFTDLEFDDALREFLSYFVLPGEAQQIDRIIEQFAGRYHEQNPHLFKTKDAAYVLAFAIIMLNTDAHNPKIKRRMTREEFVKNLRGINDSDDLEGGFLEGVYERIVANEIRMKDASELLDADEYRDMFFKGTDFVKHGRRGKPHARKIWISEDGKRVMWKIPNSKDTPKEMLLSEVVGVHKGASTAVFKRTADIARKNKLCFSLVGKKRTLDLEAPTEQIRDIWFDHFCLIMQRNTLETRARERKRLLQKRGKTYARTKSLWEEDILPHWQEYVGTPYLRQVILQGMPTFVRGRVWNKLIGNTLGITLPEFQDCVAQARVTRSFMALLAPNEKITGFGDSMLRMKRDVESSFPDIVVRLQGESEGSEEDGGEKAGAQPLSQEVLDVLDAWIIHRPEVGYVEGMAFIASMHLLYNAPFESFVAMSNMMQMPILDAFISKNALLVEARLRYFERALKDELPSLHSHFARIDVRPQMYVTDWFITVFARALPLEICTRIWDWFYLDGEVALFRTAYGVLYVLSNRLENSTREEALTLLQGRFVDLEAPVLFQAIEKIKLQPKRWNDFLASLEESNMPGSRSRAPTIARQDSEVKLPPPPPAPAPAPQTRARSHTTKRN